MILRNNYAVDFRKDKSMNSLQGFDSKFYTSGFNESENMVNILTINRILVNIDIISGSYINGFTCPDVSSGYKIIENSHNLLYLPITSDRIHSITVWLTDQNGSDLNLTRREFVNFISFERDLKISEFLK